MHYHQIYCSSFQCNVWIKQISYRSYTSNICFIIKCKSRSYWYLHTLPIKFSWIYPSLLSLL